MTDSGQVSTVGFKWARRMIVIAAILFAFGTWALYDAAIKYPARGREFAQWAQWQYLIKLDAESQSLRDPGILTRNAPIADPKAELERLLADPPKETAPDTVQARFQWLEALSFIGELDPESTAFKDAAPRQKLAQLNQDWGIKTKPSPLHSYDIPAQWLMMVVGYGLGLYMLFLLVRVKITKYRFDPERKALTLPNNATITPSDLEEVDKRKWDKFIVFLRIKPGVDKVGGKAVRIDTFRHDLVEEWILDMEREAFPSEEDETTESTDSDHAQEPAPEPAPADEKG
jgi:hypothetical protein